MTMEGAQALFQALAQGSTPVSPIPHIRDTACLRKWVDRNRTPCSLRGKEPSNRRGPRRGMNRKLLGNLPGARAGLPQRAVDGVTFAFL
jgi:hypothetical protein